MVVKWMSYEPSHLLVFSSPSFFSCLSCFVCVHFPLIPSPFQWKLTVNDVLMTEQMCRSCEGLWVHYVVKHSKRVAECEHRRRRRIDGRHYRTASTVRVAAGREPAAVGQSAQQRHRTAALTDFANCSRWMSKLVRMSSTSFVREKFCLPACVG